MNYRTGTVVAADGTAVSHRVVGDGGTPIVLVHGGIQAAQSFRRLAEILSGRYTVYIPDRRGRRPEVPAGDDYGLAREGEDLHALLSAVGARRVFGLSSGAIIALYTAIQCGGVDQLALYEPPLTIDEATPAAWLPNYERALAASGPAAAVTEVLKGTGDRSPLLLLPKWALTALIRAALAIDAKWHAPGDIALRDLVPTMRLDGIATVESVTLLNPRIEELRSDVLLLGGQKSAHQLHLGLDALAGRLPNAQRVELKRIGHIAADNRRGAAKSRAAARRLLDGLSHSIRSTLWAGTASVDSVSSRWRIDTRRRPLEPLYRRIGATRRLHPGSTP